MSRYCSELTGIQQSDVDGADYLPQVLQRFGDWLDEYLGPDDSPARALPVTWERSEPEGPRVPPDLVVVVQCQGSLRAKIRQAGGLAAHVGAVGAGSHWETPLGHPRHVERRQDRAGPGSST